MMMDKRLLRMVPESKKYIGANVACQWVALGANIGIMYTVAGLLAELWKGEATAEGLVWALCLSVLGVVIRFFCALGASHMSYLSARAVKKTLRERIYRKLLGLGTGYAAQVETSQVVQVAVEGVDQLETYFGAYLPQFFYAMLAPVTLFVVLCRISLGAAVVLLICVPLIPVTIVAVQRWAKKLLSKYWGEYTALGDTFLENLQGLTTTKIYQSDEFKHQEMNRQSEHFRKITMKVLTMQLNSITIMDLIAYGGTGLGAILAVWQFRSGTVTMMGCLMIMLLAADFFLPMRLLGSYFHIAMNGMAASDKIFRLLELPEPEHMGKALPTRGDLVLEDVCFSYTPEKPILEHIDMTFPEGSFTAIVGESGSGKSTVASLIMGRNKSRSGEIRLGKTPIAAFSEGGLMEHITYISHQSYLFKGTVRENLRMGDPEAGEEDMWQALEQVNLAGFLRSGQGLDTPLLEKGANLSGGQCQRLALARALLHDSPVYIFDEATSNIDVESENQIMAQIYELAKTKTVILISHRMANVVGADRIYVLQQGKLVEQGNHRHLLEQNGVYGRLFLAQQALETYVKGDVTE